MNANLIVYDIPQTSGFPNPTPRLRRVAIRINYSCWVVPSHRIPYPLLYDFNAHGVEWDMVKFEAAEGEKLAKMAEKSLRKEIRAALQRAREAQDRAADTMADTVGSAHDRMAARDAFVKKAQAIRRKITILINDLRHAGSAFNLSDNQMMSLSEAQGAIGVLKAAVNQRVNLYVETLQTARRRGGSTSRAVADAVEQHGAPIGILADSLMDDGIEINPLDIHNAFADE